jgi:U3 small nucleolar RNA-associated protein 3
LSDEEVLALSDQDEDDEDEEEEGIEEEMEDDEDAEGWGRGRKNYYGADELEDEEDARLEEEEALRLQQKHLQGLSAEDYYEEDDLEEWKRSAKETIDAEANVVHEQLPQQDPSLLNDSEKLEMINISYPEMMPLAKELGSLKDQLPELKEKAGENDVCQIKFCALSAYLGTINAYFALFVNGIGDKITFKDHPVMEGILKAREVWRAAKDLNEDGMPEEDESEEGDEEQEANGMYEEDFEDGWESLDEEEEGEEESVPVKNNKRKAEEEDEDDDEFDISRAVKTKPSKKKKKRHTSDYGEQDELNDIDMEEKEAKKRSIRFYTSKISQESKKEQERLGGDDDLPYKERHYERQQRLNEEARKRGEKGAQNDAADNFDDSDEEDEKTSRQVKAGFDDDYYNMVKTSADKKKQDKKKSHELAVKAAKEGKLAELQGEVDESGKRAIDYQILKNKGLTPKRNKDNRNARVKKRKKYAAAQKKLSSTRRVYQQPTSSYGGEQTGIRKNLSRSVKFK